LKLFIKCLFTIPFDETDNAQDKKQCDYPVRVWYEQKGEISTMFLKDLMFGHEKGETMSNVPIENLV